MQHLDGNSLLLEAIRTSRQSRNELDLLLIRVGHVHVYQRWNSYEAKPKKPGGGYHTDKFAESLGFKPGRINTILCIGRRLLRIGHFGLPLYAALSLIGRASNDFFEKFVEGLEMTRGTNTSRNLTAPRRGEEFLNTVLSNPETETRIEQLLQDCQKAFDLYERQQLHMTNTCGRASEPSLSKDEVTRCTGLQMTIPQSEDDIAQIDLTGYLQPSFTTQNQFSTSYGCAPQALFNIESTEMDYTNGDFNFTAINSMSHLDLANVSWSAE